jgi:hypothetical protein
MKPKKLNTRPDNFSRILIGADAGNVDGSLPDEHLLVVHMVNDYFVDIV